MPQLNKLSIFIVGTTAVGKTKLSVYLARKYNGEIISCDSKQLYRHVSIMTAKVKQDEAQGIVHHMIDRLDLQEKTYNRNKYFKEAYYALLDIQNRGKVPIVVGGTNYYIYQLLYNIDVKTTSEYDSCPRTHISLDHMTKTEKYVMLEKVDQMMATKLHPNDEVRVTSFLTRCLYSGQQVSENYGLPFHYLRNPNTLLFWIRNSDREELMTVAINRIDKMVGKYGICYILAAYAYLEDIPRKEYYREPGIATSIGIKYFQPFYEYLKPTLMKLLGEHPLKDYQQLYQLIFESYDQIEPSININTLTACKKVLEGNTKHYCKNQITWIRNRIFVNVPQQRQHFFVLYLQQNKYQPFKDVLTRFDEQVATTAKRIVETVLEHGFGAVYETEKEFKKEINKRSTADWKKYVCEECDVNVQDLYSWKIHITSPRHLKRLNYLRKKYYRVKTEAYKKKNIYTPCQYTKQKYKNPEAEYPLNFEKLYYANEPINYGQSYQQTNSKQL